MPKLDEFELTGIETIARGVCVRNGEILLCRGKGAKSTYLPGGHIEFGETGRQALVREVKEEMGLDSTTGKFLGVVENSFLQKSHEGKMLKHAEINLVYELKVPGAAADPKAAEAWIGFEWCPLADLDKANLLPAAFRVLGKNPSAIFEA